MNELDWLIRGCRDAVTGETVRIGIHDGRIAFAEPVPELGAGDRQEVARAKNVFDATGYVALPGLIETHIHLDKAFLADRMPGEAADLKEAISMTAALKSSYTPEDISARSRRLLDRASRFGVTRMRTQVEIDPILRLMSWHSAVELKKEYEGKLDLQLVAFPQEGIFWQPGTAALLEEAARAGADAIGGVPYNDRDSLEHLEYVFRLAESCGLPVDLHLDFSDDPDQLAIVDVIALTKKYGLQGRVAVGHLTSLGSAEPETAKRIAAGMADAGIHVFTLPATDLYLNGRQDSCRVRRGLAPVNTLLEAGVNVCFGSNNVRNAFTPFGTGDPLDIALLLAQTAHMGSAREARLLAGMCTVKAAEALGVRGTGGLSAGEPADLVLVKADGILDVIYDRPRERAVWKSGALIHGQMAQMVENN
ncbi:amidohydrolase family protein [Cohnella thailandensis]|uniref:Amidohydrolase family protein n=1 Tax=Cohnella thailandensis TaxID=557557 RepID=A0A841T684_9BACL|nr:amidohydrolase family protein [Cohnella thailandensis]MBB6636651.1 amidohydrolase family protein [Cohnella thailandensis]MBP1973473.1 cytosine deaminase [Cohnella thailandensis]